MLRKLGVAAVLVFLAPLPAALQVLAALGIVVAALLGQVGGRGGGGGREKH